MGCEGGEINEHGLSRVGSVNKVDCLFSDDIRGVITRLVAVSHRYSVFNEAVVVIVLILFSVNWSQPGGWASLNE
jgi:hypothetical protein